MLLPATSWEEIVYARHVVASSPRASAEERVEFSLQSAGTVGIRVMGSHAPFRTALLSRVVLVQYTILVHVVAFVVQAKMPIPYIIHRYIQVF